MKIHDTTSKKKKDTQNLINRLLNTMDYKIKEKEITIKIWLLGNPLVIFDLIKKMRILLFISAFFFASAHYSQTDSSSRVIQPKKVQTKTDKEKAKEAADA